MRLATSLLNFECQLCGIFEGLSHNQEFETSSLTTFAVYSGLGEIIKKLVSSNFMGMIRSVSFIFDSGSN